MMQEREAPGPSAARDGKEYVPLPLIGQIREKGFSGSDSPSRHWHRVSAPEPRATPFPVARHRSEGPHWLPPSQPVQILDAKEDWEDDHGEQLATNARPLNRKKKKVINFSKRKAENGQKEVFNLVRDSVTECNTSCTQSSVSASNRDKHNIEEDCMPVIASSDEKEVEAHISRLEHLTRSVSVDSRPATTSTFSKEYNLESRRGLEEDISSINESTLESMTMEQIAEAQQELAERFRPEILDMLKRRGKKKSEKQSNNESNLDTHSDKTVSPAPKVGKKDFEECEQWEDAGSKAQGLDLYPSPSIEPENLGDQFLWRGRSWTERVEAVRLFRFSLDGNVVGIGSAAALPSTGDKDSQWRLSVTERDFLRMEGDPSSDGYTIKEAVALARSMVPAQRSAALRLLGNILNKAMLSLQLTIDDESFCSDLTSTQSVDWQAVWAYALGPEPELVLTLRMALDDSHATAVVTCARALEFLLSSSANEDYFNLYESLSPAESYMFTAPVFQKPLFKESGLIGDCYWKYNVKPADMFPFSKNIKSQGEDTDATVKDDASVANQDVAAGLIRMGLLPRIRYLLEVERLTSAEDSLFTILIALSRHSPGAADAIVKCPRLMDTIQQLFVLDETLTWPARPKAIRLLKTLSIASRVNCVQLINMGVFESSQVGLLHQGLNLGTRKQKQEGISWEGLAESLGFWRICISYGLCISRFSDFYPALLFWIAAPVRQPLQATFDVKDAILVEASFHVLEALASTLPILHSKEDMDCDTENLSPTLWSWNFAIPIVESSLGWLSFDFSLSCTQNLQWCNDGHNSSKSGTDMCLRIMSSVLHLLSTVCERVLEEGSSGSSWLPTFVPKLGLQLVKSGLLGFRNFDSSSTSLTKCYLESMGKASGKKLLEAKNCLHALVQLLRVLDRLLASVKADEESNGACKSDECLCAEEILKNGLILSAKEELVQLLRVTGDDLIRKCGILNMVDTSRRGGPTPGIGIGWGCQGGGHWSHQVLAAQIESVLTLELMELLNVKESLSDDSLHVHKHISGPIESWRIKVGVSVSLLAGPCHKDLVERVCCAIILNESSLYFYLEKTGPLLKKWLSKLEKDKNLQEIENLLDNLCLKVEDVRYLLLQHVKSVWLCRKVKSSSVEHGFIDEKRAKECGTAKRHSILSTVPEDSASMSASFDRSSLAVEWGGQKLPLPSIWFWSPLLSDGNLSMGGDTDKTGFSCTGLSSADVGEIIKHGLLLLYGLEALDQYSPPLGFKVPVARKIHALSSIFVVSDDVFLENIVRSMVGALQEMYIYQLDSTSEENEIMEDVDVTEQYVPAKCAKKYAVQKLDFEGLVDERYLSFLDKLTNQFSSVSYGDLVFARQIAIYLRRDVSESLRLRVWKSLESEHMLEFLPPLEKCCGPCTMYLYPTEESHELLKAYASAWASGALDRAIACQSLSFLLAVSHVASFIFKETDGEEMIASRKNFAKNFLLQAAQRPQFQESLLQLLNCKVLEEPVLSGVEGTFRPPSSDEIKMRCKILEEACAQYSHLVDRIQHLRNA